MKTARKPVRRGSAMVELALFMTVFVPVLMYSGYLVDALFFSLKAQEAMSAAAWDMTGRLLHDYCPGSESSCGYDHTGKYNTAFTTVDSRVKGRYVGLDVWPADATGSALTQLAGTGAKGFLSGREVSCQAASGVSDPVGDILGKIPSLGSPSPSTALHTGGLISCQAQATVQNYYLGNKPSTSTTIGPEQQALWQADLGDITVCGSGGASGGNCPTTTTFVTYTDDWGLAEDGAADGNPSWENWPDDSESNYEFGRLGKTVFESTYPSYLQTAEAADETCFNSYCETDLGPVDDVVLLDKEFALSTPYNAFNLAEMNEYKDGVGNASLDNQSYDDVDSYEGSIQQPSYTWPMEHYKAGPIDTNAYKYVHDWLKDHDDYLGQ